MRVIRVTSQRQDAAAGVLARAFLDDPMMRWSMGGDLTDRPGLGERFTAYFRTVNAPNVDAGWVWETEDGSGAAVWLPPEATASFLEDDLATRPAIAGFTDDPGRYGEFWDWLDSHIPDEPMWFLDQIGVEPDHQGHGTGRALVDHGLRMARSAGLAAYLETGTLRNVTYYETFGFRVVHEGNAPGDGPHIWFMQTESAEPSK